MDRPPDPLTDTPADPPAEALAGTLARLRPYPEDGARADGPVAVDATDRLLLDETRPLLARLGRPAGPDDVVVVDDRFGALTLGALALGAPAVRVHQDLLTARRALDANAAALGVPAGTVRAHEGLDAALLAGARIVLLQLPKSLAALTETAEAVARHAADDVVVLAGGRVKHMTPTMTDVLARSFADVRATLARQKSRVLVARGVRAGARDAAPAFPVRAHLADPVLGPAGLDVVAHGAVFGAGSGRPALDGGTRLLLSCADRWAAPTGTRAVRDVVDLGCGTGVLAVVAARRLPGARIVATDVSAAAVASARATADLAGVGDRVRVLLDDAGASLPEASADVVLLNPPFHDRTAVSTDAAHRMLAAAGRALRPGGELWTVFNTPLRYQGALRRAVGPTEHVVQDPRFTVTRSVRRG